MKRIVNALLDAAANQCEKNQKVGDAVYIIGIFTIFSIFLSTIIK